MHDQIIGCGLISQLLKMFDSVNKVKVQGHEHGHIILELLDQLSPNQQLQSTLEINYL